MNYSGRGLPSCGFNRGEGRYWGLWWMEEIGGGCLTVGMGVSG